VKVKVNCDGIGVWRGFFRVCLTFSGGIFFINGRV
jgi:hypothetical protein